MKRLLLYAIIAISALTAYADLGEDGYYRVQSGFTKRYAYLLDNKGYFNSTTSSVDVRALELYLSKDMTISDPSCIFYVNHIENQSSKITYDIAGQGTSVHGFLDEYVKIYKDKKYDGLQSYLIYASKSGLTKYLGDRQTESDADAGLASADVTGDRRLWYFHKVDSSSDDCYFGIAPSVAAGGKFYHPFYASFPFSAASEGMKFYTVDQIDPRGVVVIKEIDGVIPGSTPVIAECSSALPSDNRLNIGGSAQAQTAANYLKGVYFDNPGVIHFNRTPFDQESMRVLGLKDGKLAFVKGDYEYIPRNLAYLQLTEAEQYKASDFVLMTPEEYEVYKNENNAVAVLPVSANVDVYSLDGRLVKSGISKSEVSSLGNGLYILKSGDKSEKIVISGQ